MTPRTTRSLFLAVVLAAAAGCGDKKPADAGKAPAGSGSALVGSGSALVGSGSAGSGSAISPAPAPYVVPTTARAVGAERTVTSTFALTGTTTAAGAKAPTPLAQAETATWTDTIKAMDGDVITALDISYATQTDAAGSAAAAPGPLAGKTYTATLDAKTKQVVVTGTKPTAAEKARVALAVADDVGVPALVGRVLGGTAFTLGTKVELPASALTAFFAVKEAVGTTFAMTLDKLDEQAATFSFTGTGTMKIAAVDVALTLRGTLELGASTGWVQRLETTADLAATIPVLTGTATGSQTITYR